MDDPLAGPCLSLDELDLLRASLEARLRSLPSSEAADAAKAAQFSREGYCAAYRAGQRRVLRAALAEVAVLEGSADGEAEGEGED